MIDARDILNILNDMAERGASTEALAEIHDKLAGEGLPPDIQKRALEIIAGQKHLEKEIFDKDVKEFVGNATGIITTNDVLNFFDARREQKRRIYDLIRQMEKDGLIVRTGNRNGTYRPVDSNPHIMDLDADEGENANIKLPFLLHDLVELYTKNVIVVAGEKDAGKTAFALNTAWLNKDTYRVVYINSEMGTQELKKRLAKFPQDYTKREWQKITWMEQAQNYEDHIDPDGLNIIDFLEIGKEAFTVTEDIRRSFDKLNRGLLLIVMQKRSYKEYAVGGEGTLEKARLALNLEHAGGENLCRITVAKNWKGTEKPRGKVCKYKIRNGGEIWMDNYWYEPDKGEASPVHEKGFKAKQKPRKDIDGDDVFVEEK